jgi:hypothetical protein
MEDTMSAETDEKKLSAQLEEAIGVSIEHYAAMLELLEKISAGAGEDGEILKSLAGEFQLQQQRIEDVDESLNRLLHVARQSSPQLPASLPCFEERVELMGKVKQMNDLLLPKISGIMALISHEIGELKGGRNAISGYRVQSRSTKSKHHYTA